MATLSEITRTRKLGLKRLQAASVDLDAKQERVEREIKRLLTRKRAVPEVADMVRVLGLIKEVSLALDAISRVADELQRMYGT